MTASASTKLKTFFKSMKVRQRSLLYSRETSLSSVMVWIRTIALIPFRNPACLNGFPSSSALSMVFRITRVKSFWTTESKQTGRYLPLSLSLFLNNNVVLLIIYGLEILHFDR